jgi:hypothetical protein
MAVVTRGAGCRTIPRSIAPTTTQPSFRTCARSVCGAAAGRRAGPAALVGSDSSRAGGPMSRRTQAGDPDPLLGQQPRGQLPRGTCDRDRRARSTVQSPTITGAARMPVPGCDPAQLISRRTSREACMNGSRDVEGAVAGPARCRSSRAGPARPRPPMPSPSRQRTPGRPDSSVDGGRESAAGAIRTGCARPRASVRGHRAAAAGGRRCRASTPASHALPNAAPA